MTHTELRHIRTALLHYTQSQLARALGVSTQTIRNWESPPTAKNHRPIKSIACLAILDLADHALLHRQSVSPTRIPIPDSSSP